MTSVTTVLSSQSALAANRNSDGGGRGGGGYDHRGSQEHIGGMGRTSDRY